MHRAAGKGEGRDGIKRITNPLYESFGCLGVNSGYLHIYESFPLGWQPASRGVHASGDRRVSPPLITRHQTVRELSS
jgi:hypothetical protein